MRASPSEPHIISKSIFACKTQDGLSAYFIALLTCYRWLYIYTSLELGLSVPDFIFQLWRKITVRQKGVTLITSYEWACGKRYEKAHQLHHLLLVVHREGPSSSNSSSVAIGGPVTKCALTSGHLASIYHAFKRPPDILRRSLPGLPPC